ncbi:MAG: DUF4382 domain-containing protein [Alkalispirochaeta sp.]
MKRTKKTHSITMIITVLVAATTLLVAGCSMDGDGSTGIMNLSMTDAPLDASGVNGVYITVEGIEYNLNGQWETMSGFDGPQTFDLAALTGGDSELLGALQLPAGDYTQIRFMLGVAEQEDGTTPSNPGSWIEYGTNDTYDKDTDGDTALFVPSGGQTGYKAEAGEPFTVPANGSVNITADFDLRKAVVEAGASGLMILKPVLRLIVEDQAGSISGSVTNEGTNDVVVYAYEDGDYVAGEADDPADGESRFPNAVTSARPDSDGNYTLAFLAAGTYDLVVAEYSDGEYVLDSAAEVAVAADKDVSAGEATTEVDITITVD